ncbi:hypothetical protein [Actinomadura sp. HBU206391]|uniref:hypothetical protein n=1 Tax=Actinomadura sp. HBU206391 TaxID=2731692 RepID=UPI00164F90EB|nr:hypothetical protein [Actinomadura sp. HBU206391]MBC6458631.1 hypothetical protein [Actinomadura sp. HBU206391]
MSFVQILEFDTKKSGEIQSLMNEWRVEMSGKSMVRHEVVARDRTLPDHYVAIMEFPSWEDAQRTSKLAETGRFAAKMAELCDGPVKFVDYDVIRDES